MSEDIERLTALFGSVTEIEASYKVYASATYYPDFVRVYIPNEPYDKLLPGMERKSVLVRTKIGSGEATETDIERSLRRSKKAIRDYALCNKFELFATFTFKDDRQNIARSKTKMANWLKNQQKRKGRFEYLIVPEFHKDRESLHFHALIKNYSGEVKAATHNGQPVIKRGRQYYELPSYQSGFTNVKKIDNTLESHTKIGFYVSKYITKDMPLFFGKNRYWASGGLALPRTEDNPDTWYLRQAPQNTHETEYGRFLYFNKSPVKEA
jgi:hypothetical protein